MANGIRTAYRKTADQSIASSAVLVSTGLTSPIAAGQTQKIDVIIPFNVGATGGIRVQVVVPGAVADFVAEILLCNAVAPSFVGAIQVTSAAFTNAVANAGNHWLRITGTVTNGANAGTIDIQAAQNTSDVLPLVILQGATMEVTTL